MARSRWVKDLQVFRNHGRAATGLHKLEALSGATEVLHVHYGIKHDPHWKELHAFAYSFFDFDQGEMLGAICGKDKVVVERALNHQSSQRAKIIAKTWQ